MSHKINPEFQEKAKKAKDKKASLGKDIDLSSYQSEGSGSPLQIAPGDIAAEDKHRMLSAGVMLDDLSQRSGTFIQKDNTPIHHTASQEGIEVMATSEALKKYEWLEEYLWKAVQVDADKYTAHVELNNADGYFIRALPGKKSVFPVQACLYLAKSKLIQDVHNIIIAEEGSELHIITGCAVAKGREPGLHLGVSEFYIKKGAKVTFSMIHSWSPEVEVRPRTGAILEEDAQFMSNYVIMRPVHSLQSYPSARCVGKNATARFNSILVATPGSHIDTGSKVILEGEGSKTEVISRAITTGGTIVARGYIEGAKPDVKGHLECSGLILGDNGGIIHAIPELKGSIAGVDLSHEAAVGKIAEEEVEYLMARGLTREEATAAIVRGFLNVDIVGLPAELNAELKKAIEESEGELF
ncbi:MAG: SufD family Fe-S cluster assembly protein [Dehalococcoidaceae bacterium]|nr:SufD family Fe-S cluster assembly protein [Dehalococcoidaceae bacterium]